MHAQVLVQALCVHGCTRVSCIVYRVSCIVYRVSCIVYRVVMHVGAHVDDASI
jgi:hypothetical protein